MIWLALLRRFWWAIPMMGLIATTTLYLHQRNSARAQVIQLRDDLAAIRAANNLAIKKAIYAKEQADAAYRSSNDAAVLLGNDLSARVRDYENRLRHDAVPSAGQPVETVGSAAPVAPTGPGIDAFVGDAIAACTRDANRLQNAVDWAASVNDRSPPHP